MQKVCSNDIVIAGPWLEMSTWWEQAQRDNCPYVDKDLPGTDSELGQMLMTCGELSNQATSVKSRLNVSHCPSEQQLMGSDIAETLWIEPASWKSAQFT